MTRQEPEWRRSIREAAASLGLERVRKDRYEGHIDGLRVQLQAFSSGEQGPVLPHASVWFARPPSGDLTSRPWGGRHLLVRQRSARKTVLIDNGADLAVVKVGSAEQLDRMEADGRLDRLLEVYRRFPHLIIARRRIRARLEDFDDIPARVEDLARVAHELTA